MFRGIAAGEYHLRSDHPDKHYGKFGRTVRLSAGTVTTAHLAVPWKARISGTVTDAVTGEPTEMTVRVSVGIGAPGSMAANTDDNGNYEMYVATRGEKLLETVSLTHGRYEQLLTIGRADQVVDIRLKPYVPADVVGLVRTEAGDPVAEQSVSLLVGHNTIATAVTGADGRYRFPDVEPGSYTVMISMEARVVVGVFVVEEDSEVVADDLVVEAE